MRNCLQKPAQIKEKGQVEGEQVLYYEKKGAITQRSG